MLFALQPPGALMLYSFRFVDPVTGKWVRARYVAELHEIQQQSNISELSGSLRGADPACDYEHEEGRSNYRIDRDFGVKRAASKPHQPDE